MWYIPQTDHGHIEPKIGTYNPLYHAAFSGHPRHKHHSKVLVFFLPERVERYNVNISGNNFMTIILQLLEMFTMSQNAQMKCESTNELHIYASIITWKQSMRSPGKTAMHSEISHGRERRRTDFLTLTHSSSSAPNPANLTWTSWNE